MQRAVTIPEMLKPAGYFTAMTGKWHVGLSFFDKDGQRITKGGVEGVKMIDYSRAIPDAPIHRGFDRFLLLQRRGPDSTSPAPEVAAAACNQYVGVTEPFFSYVHLVDPHLPYNPRRTWDDKPRERVPITVEEADAPHVRTRPVEFMRRAIDLYDGEIRQADAAVATILGCLAERRELDSTLVLVTADHGEEFEEHGRMSHGQTLFQESIAVPWIVAGPEVKAQGHVAVRVSAMDVAPTVLRWAGEEDNFASDGLDLTSLLAGTSAPSAWANRPFLLHLDHPDGTALAELHERYKMILRRRPYAKQLFDLASDGLEQRSLWDEKLSPPLAAEAHDLGETLAATYNALRREMPPVRSADIIPSERAAFAALGYVGMRPEARPSLPARIMPPGPNPQGRLGWEPTRTEPCVVLAGDDNPSLLAGWYDAQDGGRWSQPSATLAVARGETGATVLELSGTNFRTDSPRLRLTVDERAVLATDIAPGAFRVRSTPVALVSGQPKVIHLDVDPPFVPGEHGMRDDRVLGIFFNAICLTPAP